MALVKINYNTTAQIFENPATYGSNLLTGDQTDFEGGTTGSWTGSAGYALTNSAAIAQGGTHSLQCVSSTTGAKTITSPTLTVVAGTAYGAYGWFRANSTIRFVNASINWYSDAGATTLISTTTGGIYTESNSAWVRGIIGGTAPATAIRAKLVFTWANSANPETHFFDTAFFGTVTAATNTATTIKIEGWGRGGQGGVGVLAASGGGGGGGGYSRTNAFAVEIGQSYTVTVGVLSSARDTYFTTNSAIPTSNTTGVLAKGGSNGSAASGLNDGSGSGGGQASAGFGVDAKFSGGNGQTGAAGGGGAGDAANGSGQTAGSAGGGNGGAAGGGTGNLLGGGGGGGSTGSGAGGNGANGRLIITIDTGDDSVTSTDAFTRVMSWSRSIGETPTATDTIAKSVSRPSADSVTATDSNAKTYSKNNADTVTTSDAVAKVVSKTSSDTVTASDAQTITLIAIRNFNESVAATDAIAKAVSAPKADNVTTSEVSVRQPKPNKSDTLTASDVFTKVSSFSRTIAETILTADSIAKTINVRLSDTISGSAPDPVVVNPPYVLTTDGQLEKFVADINPYPLYVKL